MRYFRAVFLALAASLLQITSTLADPGLKPASAGNAYDLINAVNALRASNGLPAYSISPILMFTAQNQADFMAANQIVTHSGPGGISVTDRLLAAGYPLAGDLSLGGFRSENIIAGTESMTAGSAVDQWTGDAPHLNTMLSPNLTEIGAGVAINAGRVYYVIDAARPTTSGQPQAVTPVIVGGTVVPAGEAPIPVVVISTPGSDGRVIHEVQPGQSLWQIAIAYDTKIDEIKQLNQLSGNNIFPGDKLLIRQTSGTATNPATDTPAGTNTTAPATSSLTVQPTVLADSTAIPVVTTSAPPTNQTIAGVAIALLVMAMLVGLFFGRQTKPEP